VTTTTDCPIWCQLFTAEHKRLHGAHKASFAGATAQATAALVHHPGASELTVEIAVRDPAGGEQVAEMTAMAAMDLAQALTALAAELARIGSAAPLAWPSQDQPDQAGSSVVSLWPLRHRLGPAHEALTSPARAAAGTTPTGSQATPRNTPRHALGRAPALRPLAGSRTASSSP
jgi:hypothetical protein